MRFTSMDHFKEYVSRFLPDAIISEDADGNLAIYPGLVNDGPGGVIPIEES